MVLHGLITATFLVSWAMVMGKLTGRPRWQLILTTFYVSAVVAFWVFIPEESNTPEPKPPTPAQVCEYHKGIRNVDGDGYSTLYVTCNDNYYQETWNY